MITLCLYIIFILWMGLSLTWKHRWELDYFDRLSLLLISNRWYIELFNLRALNKIRKVEKAHVFSILSHHSSGILLRIIPTLRKSLEELFTRIFFFFIAATCVKFEWSFAIRLIKYTLKILNIYIRIVMIINVGLVFIK